ncbi:MAG: hypothetical protein K9N55_06115, partial [Phycisphaerae bacterium]|nr:hypothetical protein [Phycisphaerae bacterium]
VASLESATLVNHRNVQAMPGTLVQFYVEAVDRLGHTSWHPAAGPEAHAQFQYQDNQSPGTALHTYRVVMRKADRDLLFEPANLMSNERLGVTLIYNEQDIFYDIGVRLKSSEHGRPKSPRVGYSMRFNADKLFRGVHDTLAFDRSDGQTMGQREMLSHMAMNRFGHVSKYSDLGYLIAPSTSHTGGVEVQMARYGDVFLEETYGKDGGQGTLFEYELVYPLTQTVGNDPEGLKIPQEGSGVQGRSVSDYLGEDKELYRWHFLIKNHRDQDDYNGIITMTRILGLTGPAFEQAANDLLDVDQWLNAFAVSAALGISDNWIDNAQHNAMFYVRSSDRKILFLPHDMDFLYSVSRSITSNSTLRKMMAVPQWHRRFYGYVAEYLQTSFNRAYLSHWTDQFSELLPQQPWSSRLDYVNARHQNVLTQVRNAVGSEVPFSIDTAEPLSTDQGTLVVTGTGWVTVFNIRVQGVQTNLEIQWLDATTWQTQLTGRLANRPDPVTLEALNSQGDVVGTDSF